MSARTRAKAAPHAWLDKADGRYVAARSLYWEHFSEEFALVGSLAFELYLKAYLVFKTNNFARSHDLGKLCQLCGVHDPFFVQLTSDPNWAMTWPTYFEFFRYPESLAKQTRPHYAVTSGGPGGTLEVLDSVADFVRSQIPRPRDDVDLIAVLISGRREGRFWYVTPPHIFGEIRQSFLHENKYFSHAH